MLDQKAIEEILAQHLRRMERIRDVGGISVIDVHNGATIPPGWVYDVTSNYFIPPNFSLTTH